MDATSKSRIYSGEGKYIKGTGGFEGIQGSMIFKEKYITPFTPDKTKGDSVVEVTAAYSLQ